MRGRIGKVPPPRLAEAIEEACGNLTHAAAILGISRVHATRLAGRYALAGSAAEMRALVGRLPTTGDVRSDGKKEV
jgi:hypothetical protein